MSTTEHLTPSGVRSVPGAVTPAVLTRGTDLVLLPGQVAWDAQGALVATVT
ncbi:hypothetical protein [Actinoallomurus sp. NPDC052274]|uniref:hypothetical protein n=1 Tax=Actinoallomurus sp. NPDC052274 TaxID=3155420 RepID=UPI003437244D